MAYADLREFIAALERAGELLRVRQEVHWRYELGGWSRLSLEKRPPGPALLFELLTGYPAGYRVFTCGIAATRRFCIALELDPGTPHQELLATYRERLDQPLPPQQVDGGPCKEHVLEGEDALLTRFPIPWWTPRDGGRYLGTWHGVVSKDPETGQCNIGTYRLMLHGPRHCSIGFLPSSHLGQHYAKSEARGEPLEVAIVIGADETLVMAGASGFPYGVDEYAMAGGLRRAPLHVTPCETVNLEAPANSEIVIEGLLLPKLRAPEGPFGEHSGYHGGGVRPRPIIAVSAITHRSDPILRGALLGKPPTEDHLLYSVACSAAAMRMFATHGPPGVTAVHCPPEGDSVMLAFIAMRPTYVGHARNVARTFAASSEGRYVKNVIVVDDDIDIYDFGQVWWAINTRTQGSRDIEVQRFNASSRSDPSIPHQQGDWGDKVLIDATKKLDYDYVPAWDGTWAPVAIPPEEVMELVRLKWDRECGGGANDKEIASRQQRLQEDRAEFWQDWRRQNYGYDSQQPPDVAMD